MSLALEQERALGRQRCASHGGLRPVSHCDERPEDLLLLRELPVVAGDLAGAPAALSACGQKQLMGDGEGGPAPPHRGPSRPSRNRARSTSGRGRRPPAATLGAPGAAPRCSRRRAARAARPRPSGPRARSDPSEGQRAAFPIRQRRTNRPPVSRHCRQHVAAGMIAGQQPGIDGGHDAGASAPLRGSIRIL